VEASVAADIVKPRRWRRNAPAPRRRAAQVCESLVASGCVMANATRRGDKTRLLGEDLDLEFGLTRQQPRERKVDLPVEDVATDASE
jgi:hypothetical protein